MDLMKKETTSRGKDERVADWKRIEKAWTAINTIIVREKLREQKPEGGAEGEKK